MLSGGEQQMLALGRGLMGNPKMLLLDEPSLGLAPIVTSEIFSIVRKLAKEHAFGVLLVEQNARKALEISDRGYVLVNGTIELSGRSEELRENPEVQKLYLGGKMWTLIFRGLATGSIYSLTAMGIVLVSLRRML